MPTATTSKPAGIQTIRLTEWGSDLTGRTLGEEVRQQVCADAAEVVFECTGIESMSPSFADEVFGKLSVADPRPPIRVVNAAPEIISVIRFAVQERQEPPA